MIYAIISWASTVFNWTFSLTTLLVLVIPIVLDKYTKYKMKVGYFALALSLCMNVNKTFNKLTLTTGLFDMTMCSVLRFRYFIPPGQKLTFGKFVNAHEEDVVKPNVKGTCEIDKRKLLKRRALEFRADNKKFRGLRKLFFNPKVNILDLGRYLTREHRGVDLKDVCVYTSLDHNPDGMILKHITVSAHRSGIGIIGRTGAGKTTLLSVLQNIMANRTGQVLLDGKDLNDIPKVVLRQIIGVLPQLPFVFKGWTIRRFLDPRKLFTDEEINHSLNKCGLLNLVDELPGGMKLDTVIVSEEPVLLNHKGKGRKSRTISFEKERSMSMGYAQQGYEADMLLSNNQLRTLSLARLVLYRDFFRVIIVDEPPEEDLMDEGASKREDLGVPIYELLQKYFNHCTTFLIAHDAHVLKTCTNIWVIHDGSLIRTCKTSDIAANESIANIIEESVKYRN